MDPRALPKMYFLFSDALFELIPRKRPGRKLTARKARDEFDFSRVYYFQAADLEMREIPPSVMANGFTLVNHADDATWSDLGFYASTPQELRGWVVKIKGMRRSERRATVSCPKCSAQCLEGVDRCHVCFAILIQDESHSEG